MRSGNKATHWIVRPAREQAAVKNEGRPAAFA
jgi:hypothetical protein